MGNFISRDIGFLFGSRVIIGQDFYSFPRFSTAVSQVCLLTETSEFDALNEYGNSFHNFGATCSNERSPAVTICVLLVLSTFLSVADLVALEAMHFFSRLAR